MNILILSWRDPQNPKRGGAEAVMFKYAKYWAESGHLVWWLGNQFSNSSEREELGKIKILRQGPNLPYHSTFLMLLWYPIFLLKAIYTAWVTIRQQKINLVVDAVHGLPLFSPLYSTSRKILWVCEVAGTIWDKMYPFPINKIGKTLEKFIYWIYGKTEVWAISESTKQDILLINKRLNIKVIPLGIDVNQFKSQTKFPYPSAIFMARLVKMKGIEAALMSAKQICNRLPNFKLYIVGGGHVDYIQRLKSYIRDNHLEDNVEWMGRASDKIRNRLYAKCHFLIHPSYKEGFGLTVLEAAACGTPTIARSGSSMNELIKHGVNGLLFDYDDQIGQFFVKYYGSKMYKQLVRSSIILSKKYDWSLILNNSGRITKI